MTAIFFKELRENARWAGMIGAAFCALVFLQAWHAGAFYLLNLPDPMTLIYAPLAGLAMGFAQSAFESRPDNWAFVVHRPIPRAGIFGAKCAAGLLLLYLSLGMPCALAAVWAAHPGNLPMPFQGRTVLPLVADVLTAGCYYFVGILLTLRKARWLGTRLLPVGLAFACSVMVRLTPDFWQAVVFIAVVQCVGAAAAWGAFASGGAGESPGAPRVALGVMIYSGALTIGFFLSGTLAIFETTVIWRNVRMTPDGHLVQTTKTFRDDDLTYVVADLNGRPLPEFEGLNLDDPANADRFARFTPVFANDRDLPWPMSTMAGGGYRSARPGIRMLRSFGKPGARLAATPLLDVHERIIDLYDPVTCTLIGRVGPAGFSAGGAGPVERFSDEPLGGMTQGTTRTLAFPAAVYWMELDQRSLRKLFAAAQDGPVLGAHELPPQNDPTILVATRTKLHLLDPSGKTLMSVPLDADLNHCQVQAARLAANNHLVLRAEALSPDLEQQFPIQFIEYAEDGKLVREATAPELEQSDSVTEARTAAFAAVHPLAGIPLHRAWLVDSVFLLDSRHHQRLFYSSVVAGSLLAALATFILSGRYGFGSKKRLAWTLGNLLIGPAGVVVMAGLNEWPAREVCPGCRGARFSGHRQCAACGASLGNAETDGREIFEPVDAFAGVA
jgi:hypothetical protein